MANFSVDLGKLADESKKVTVNTFGAISQNSLSIYETWVRDQLQGENVDSIENTINAIRSACDRTVVLMEGGVSAYIEWAVAKFEEIKSHFKDVAIYPIMNQEIKSDAWLIGLVFDKLRDKKIDLNTMNKGYAVDGNQAGMFTKAGSQSVKEDFVMVLMDDASYSGTQAHAIITNATKCNVFDTKKFKGGFMVLAGVSAIAKKKIEETKLARIIAQTDPMPGGVFGSPEVLKAMRSLPRLPEKASAAKGSYSSHKEVDPNTGELKATKGEFSTFADISYAIPPYKIPDSLSVPVHVYGACGYTNNNGHLPKMNDTDPPKILRHLFQSTGSIDYRTTLRISKNLFATQI